MYSVLSEAAEDTLREDGIIKKQGSTKLVDLLEVRT
jgi:hypothetical protein